MLWIPPSNRLNQAWPGPNHFILIRTLDLKRIQINQRTTILLKMTLMSMIRSVVLRTNFITSRNSKSHTHQSNLCGQQSINLTRRCTTPLLLKAMAAYYLRIIKLKSKLSFAKAGLKLNLAPMAKCARLLTESMSCKKRSMFLPDIRLNSASSIMRIITAPTVTGASLFIQKRLKTWSFRNKIKRSVL